MDLVEADGSMRRIAVVHPDPQKQELAAGLTKSWPPGRDDPLGAPRAVRTRQIEVIPFVDDEMLVSVARDPENLRTLRALGIGSVVVVPLIARGTVLGALTLVSADSGHQYAPTDIELAADLGGGAHVHPPGRLRDDQQFRAGVDLAAAAVHDHEPHPLGGALFDHILVFENYPQLAAGSTHAEARAIHGRGPLLVQLERWREHFFPIDARGIDGIHEAHGTAAVEARQRSQLGQRDPLEVRPVAAVAVETGDGVAGFIYSDLIEVREASGGVASPSATTPLARRIRTMSLGKASNCTLQAASPPTGSMCNGFASDSELIIPGLAGTITS